MKWSRRKGTGFQWTAVCVVIWLVVGSEARAQVQESAQILTLQQTIRLALERSEDLRDARLGLEVAEEQVSEARGELFPKVDATAAYTRNLSVATNFLPAIIFDPSAGPDDVVPVRFGSDNVWQTNIVVEQALFKPSVLVGLGAAGRFKSLQEESVRGQTQVVVTRVRLAYYQLLLSQEQERLTENSLHRVRKSLEETQALHRAGLASEYDVLRLQVELANLEPNVQRARNASMQARRQIAVELDISDQESLEVTGSLAEMDLEDLTANTPANREILAFTGFQGDLGDAVQVASELRSDVRQLALNEDLRRSEMRLEQVSYLPEVTLFGNYIINAQDNGSPNFFARGDGQRAYTRLVGVRVSLPIFQGFRRDARIDQKRALVRQAEAQTEKGIDQAVAQAKGLVEATDEAHQRARGQRLAVRQAERGFEIASAQYREGLSSQLELTDSEVALRQSEFNYAQAVYDYLVARAQLDEATGRVPLVDVDAQGDRF